MAADTTDVSQRTLLYIEDYRADRDLLRWALEMADAKFRLLVVDDGDQGLEAARLYRPNAILLDLNLARETGEEVLARLKADRWTRHIPVIVITNEDNLDRSLRVRELGAVEYILKPAMLPKLAAAVIEAVNRHT